MRIRSAVAAALFSFALYLHAQNPVIADPPANKAVPAAMVQIAVPSHGERLLGVLYLAAGQGLHPTAIVMHGFPGYEQNLDLAQAIRRAGWNVLAVHYRGSWGVRGEYSFTHAMEDADAEVAFLRDDTNAAKYRIDASKIVLIGHSMGGFMVASAAAHEPAVAAVVMISAWNIAGPFDGLPDGAEKTAVAKFVEQQTKNDLAPLAGTSAEMLGREAFRKRSTMNLMTFAKAMASRPVLVITSNDGLAPANDRLAAALKEDGDPRVKTLHIATDHSYSGERIQLAEAIVTFLNTIAKP